MIVTGIELGNSNSKIGIFTNEKASIVPNTFGDSYTPSIVAILDDFEAVGEETILHKADEKHTINEIKRLIGKNINDLDLTKIKYNISSNNNKLQIKINRKGNEEFFSPEQIISLIFKKLIKSASDFTGSTVKKAVITVPVYFNDKQIESIKESAKLADIDILDIINEPTAAALAYGFGTKGPIQDSYTASVIKKKSNNKKVLVFDLGGASLDVSILTIENANISVKATYNDNNLGGINFDNKLINFCINDFRQKMNIEEMEIRKDSKALSRLKIQCEKIKKKLSSIISTEISLYNFFNGLDLYIEINRERFNELCKDLYQRIENILDKVLVDSGFTKDEIDDIILAGGSSKIPKIKGILGEKFDPRKIKDQINNDEVVALGASWKAYKLDKKNSKIKFFDYLPASLGIGKVSKNPEERKKGQLICVLIPKNTKLPAKSDKKRFLTIKDNQSYFKIKIYSGEEEYVQNNRLLTEFKIENLPQKKAKLESFCIFLEVDNHGYVTINTEVESIGAKDKVSFPLEDNENINNISNIQNTLIILKLKPESNNKLNEIKNNVKIINEKNKILKNSGNEEEKLLYLNELCDACSKIINIYENLKKDNESETLYEKIFDYTKLLFTYYSQLIIIFKENNSKESDLINKIKEIIPKFKNDNIEILLEAFIELKKERPKQYIEIILFCLEILYKEGDKILEEGKKNSRYYSRKFYQKAENIKKLIDENLKKLSSTKQEQKLEEIEKQYGAKVAEIDSFVKIIKDQIKQKNTPYVPKNSGFTTIRKKLQSEDMFFVVDILQEMADSLSKGEPSEVEAYILTNIIKINFCDFENYDFEIYKSLNRRIGHICKKLEIEDDDDNEPDWHKQLRQVNEEINQREKEINQKEKEFTNKEDENKSIIKDINNIFKKKIEENKPKEFLEFIIEKYPFNNLNSQLKEELLKKDFEEVFEIIFPKYQPDNYKDKDIFTIYNEIYILLVEMEAKFINKKLK